MIKIKFLRYDNNGTHGTLCEVPSHILGMYPNYDMNSITKKQRVWVVNGTKTNFNNHILKPLLNDNDFLRSYAPAWAINGLRKYTSNLYVSLYNSVDTVVPETPLAQIPESEPVVVKIQPVEKKERKARAPKVVDEKKEKRISFKQMRTRINSKMKVIKALNHFDDPVKLRRFRGDAQSQAEKEHYDKVLTQIFKSYKTFFEEVLESRNIPFLVSRETYDVPYSHRDSGLKVEYLLVNNTENITRDALANHNWQKVTLSWMPNKKASSESRWSREYDSFMSTNRIGLAMNNANDIRKSEVKTFRSMRENTFSTIIDKALEDNNNAYTTLLENFKIMKQRIISNKVEDEKLKEYITANILSVVDPEFIINPSCDLTKDTFYIKINKDDYRGMELLEINRSVDKFEELDYRLEFFGTKSRRVKSADEAISVLNNVLASDLKSVVDAFVRASKI